VGLKQDYNRAGHGFPNSELQADLVSIPANIAEGQRRDQLVGYPRHLSDANGSLKELETH
jgi:four helix bundle protein